MSRIGRMPVHIPAGVEVTIGEGNLVTVKGPKGSLTQQLYPTMTLTQEAGVVHVARPNDEKENRALHGLTRALLHNMVVGVSEGYKKELEINGVGYRAAKEGSKLILTIGYSHPVEVSEIEGHHHRGPRAEQDRHSRLRQAEGRSVRRGGPREASSRAVQGQGHQVCG